MMKQKLKQLCQIVLSWLLKNCNSSFMIQWNSIDLSFPNHVCVIQKSIKRSAHTCDPKSRSHDLRPNLFDVWLVDWNWYLGWLCHGVPHWFPMGTSPHSHICTRAWLIPQLMQVLPGDSHIPIIFVHGAFNSWITWAASHEKVPNVLNF